MRQKKILKYLIYGLVVLLFLGAVFAGAWELQWKMPSTAAPTLFLSAAPNLGTGESEQIEKKTVPNPLAFPGAEGFGANTFGGRFGRIIFVTNLNDTVDTESNEYQGSIRWALDHEWADDPASPYDQRRFIIFKVGGTINLQKPLVISHPFTTIAGQSSPGGITLRREGLRIATHDVIVRGLRVRVGDEAGPDCCRDGINISTSDSLSDIYNVIVDHSSVSWAIDENVSFYVKPDAPYAIYNVTVQWSIISEGLHESLHIDEGTSIPDPHSMGMIIEEGVTNISIHHNLFAQNWGRNPRLSGVQNVEFMNNVIYGWDDKAVEISGNANGIRLVGNYFRLGMESEPIEIALSEGNSASFLFFDNNITDDGRARFTARVLGETPHILLSDFALAKSDVAITDALTAYYQVLDFAGAFAPNRDAVDLRVTADVQVGTGTIIDSPLEVGGWPSFSERTLPADQDNDGIPSEWEIAHGLDPNYMGDANNPNTLSPNGYSWIEEYVNSLIPIP